MGRGRLFALLALLALTGFLTTLDNTVVNVAVPTVQRELGLTVTDLEWVAASYLLGFGALLLPGGRLTDLFGRRAVLATGIAVFTAASGAADSGGTLVAARTVQGSERPWSSRPRWPSWPPICPCDGVRRPSGCGPRPLPWRRRSGPWWVASSPNSGPGAGCSH
ncbi:MFS transporter [Streptomyces sp. NBC_00996]|nr:MFS transporter [Streptomyces sp. NBC_00996]